MAAPVSTRPAFPDLDRKGSQASTLLEFMPDDPGPPPEIVRFRASHPTLGDDYYQALSAAAQVRLRLLGTLHTRGELDDGAPSRRRSAVRDRLAARRRQVWRQLHWITTEMRRLDDDA